MSSCSPTNAGRHPLYNEVHRFIYPLSISLALHALVFTTQQVEFSFPDRASSQQSHLVAHVVSTPISTAPIEPAAFTPAAASRASPLRRPETPKFAPPADLPFSPAKAIRNESNSPGIEAKTPLEPPRTGVDVAGLRQYHLALGVQARQFRRYPEDARAAGQGGRVTMRLSVSETGIPLGISLLSSSNFPVLDQAALDMMLLSASHTVVPESLRGQAFSIDLAVDFNPAEAPGKVKDAALD